MHSTYLITALAAAASVTLVSAHGSSIIKDIPALIDIDAPIGIVAPILNNADIEIIDLKKRGLKNAKEQNDNSGVFVKSKRDEKAARGLAGIEVNVGVDVSLKVNNLVKGVLTTLDPVFELIEFTVAHVEDYTTEELSEILAGAFGKIHKATSGLSNSIRSTGGGFSKRTRSNTASNEARDLVARGALLSNEEVAETLSVLLNKVAGVVNLAEGLLGKIPVLGGILLPLFGQINGDLSLILSSVGNLLVGVVSLVKNLLTGAVGTVHGLPILGSLLGGLLGGLL